MKLTLQQLQTEFSAHLRDPETAPAPDGIDDARMKIYRDLFFNNVKGFVEQAFPVLGSLWGEQKQQQEIKLFWQNHACQSPYFVAISKSFLDYLVTEREPQADDFPFLLELAHYEWVELELSVRHQQQRDQLISHDSLQPNLRLLLSELAWPLHYQFPVHRLQLDYQPQEAVEPGTFLVVYRDAQEDVQFLEINAVTAKLLELIQQQPGLTIAALVDELVQFLPQYELAQLTSAVDAVLSQLVVRGIVRQPLD